MTIRHARLLDTAFATWITVAEAFDDMRVTDTDYEANLAVLGAAADLCTSLIPLAYNFPVTDTATTEDVWAAICEWEEVLTFEQVAEMTDEFYDFKGLAALNGQKFFGPLSDVLLVGGLPIA